MDSLLETQAPSQTPRPQRSYPLDHYMDRKLQGVTQLPDLLPQKA